MLHHKLVNLLCLLLQQHIDLLQNNALPSVITSDSTISMFPGITVTYVPFAVNTVDVALTEATSDGLSTSVTFPSTFLDTPLAFLDNAF